MSYTTADLRAIIEHPGVRAGAGNVVCTEPAPDVAKALATAAQVAAKGGNGAVTADASAGVASAEAAMALAGRSTALLGLRDGLYRTCEAYANGSIGDAAYALVLSRYGQLMATLFLGQDAEVASVPAALTIQAPAVTPPAATPPAGGTQPSAAKSNMTGMDMTGPALRRDTASLQAAPMVELVTARASASNPAADEQPASPVPQAEAAQHNAAPAPTVLLAMQQSYLHQNDNLSDLLMVACINEFDPTRPGSARPNQFLQEACPRLLRNTDLGFGSARPSVRRSAASLR